MSFNSKLTYFNEFYNEILSENNNKFPITITNENTSNINIKNNFFIDKLTKKFLGKKISNYLYLYLLSQNTVNYFLINLLGEFFFVIPINIYLELSPEKNFGIGCYYKKYKEYLDNLEIKKNKLMVKLDVKKYQTENLLEYQIDKKLLNFNNLLKEENNYIATLIKEILKIEEKRNLSIFQISNKYHANSLEKNLNLIFELKNKNDYLSKEEFKNKYLLEHILNKNFHLLILEELTGINSYYWYLSLFLIIKKFYAEENQNTKYEFEEVYFKILNLLIETFATETQNNHKITINNNNDLFIINLIELNNLFMNFYSEILSGSSKTTDNQEYYNILEKKLLHQETINNILKNKENLTEILIFSTSYKEYILKYYLTILIKNTGRLTNSFSNDYGKYLKKIPNMDLDEVIKVLAEITIQNPNLQSTIVKKLKNFKIKEKLKLNTTYEFYFNKKYQNKSEIYYIFDKIKEYLENNKEEEIVKFFYKIFH